MKLIELLPKVWVDFLGLPKDYFHNIEEKIEADPINPRASQIFRAFDIEPKSVRVVIIGQDPYPNQEDAVGLAFSIDQNRKSLPGSLRNIKKELSSDLGLPITDQGDLSRWSEQGVMLLNRILTTKSGESLSHKGFGWEEFTELVIRNLAKQKTIFILWGKSASSLGEFITEDKKIIGVHPSPLSANRGFFGSKPFSECNRRLMQLGMTAIDWRV
jgi:uracil-DNA glycosylase